jgi:enoyl-CoA hydratase/carnithine racemase
VAYETLLYERRPDGVVLVTLNRPQRLNAISGRVLEELDEVLSAVEADPGARVLLLRGAPRPDGRPCFCAGFDLKSVAEGIAAPRHLGQRVCSRLDDLLVPTIAVVDGICSTGGAELAVACDLRLVGAQAQISDWHLKNLGTGLGGWGAATRWVRLVGAQKAKELFLTGRVIGPDEAVRIGWAIDQFPSEQLQGAALAMAATIASRNPNGVRMILAHMNRAQDLTLDESLAWAEELPHLFQVDVAIEGRADAVLSKIKRKE